MTEQLRVFISNSGERSRRLAEKLRQWIPKVISAAEPWVASCDIDPGRNWLIELNKNLESDRNLAVLVVTPENKQKPWLHFEMGALLQTTMNKSVIPLLFDMGQNQLQAPLNQYQLLGMTKDGMFELCRILNGQSGMALSRSELHDKFEEHWPDLDKALQKVKYMIPPVGEFSIRVMEREHELEEANAYLQNALSARIIAMTYRSLGERISLLTFPKLTDMTLYIYALPNLKSDHPILFVDSELENEWKRGLTSTLNGFLDEDRCKRLRNLAVIVVSIAPFITGTSVYLGNEDRCVEFLRMTFTKQGKEPEMTQTISVSKSATDVEEDGVFGTFKTLFNNVGEGTSLSLRFPIIRNGCRRELSSEFVDALAGVGNHPKVGFKDRRFSLVVRADVGIQDDTHVNPVILDDSLSESQCHDELNIQWIDGGKLEMQARDGSSDIRVSVRKPHIYACFLLMTYGSQLLLIKHQKGRWYYDLPGGKVASVDKTEGDTMYREAFEELGFILDRTRDTVNFGFVYDPKSAREGDAPVLAQYYHYALTEEERNCLCDIIGVTTKGHDLAWRDIQDVLDEKRAFSRRGNDGEALCHAPTYVISNLLSAVCPESE